MRRRDACLSLNAKLFRSTPSGISVSGHAADSSSTRRRLVVVALPEIEIERERERRKQRSRITSVIVVKLGIVAVLTV